MHSAEQESEGYSDDTTTSGLIRLKNICLSIVRERMALVALYSPWPPLGKQLNQNNVDFCSI